MKKYLFIALAALGFAACEEKIGDQPHSGEVEQSYIAVSLSASDLTTRAAGDSYQEGSDAERVVNTAYFFFFNEDGDAFPVTVDAPGVSGTKNHLQASLTTTNGEAMNNVSDIKNVVLLLQNYVGSYPAKIVAVLNWVPENKPYSLEELQQTMTDIRSNVSGLEGSFIMSNAVYAKEGSPVTAVYATPLTLDNIFSDEVNATANPVKIYVERVAAKITVTTASGETKFNLNKPVVVGSVDTPVYAKIVGWELFNDYQQSNLIKNIDPTWTNDALGFTWNDSPWYRCYWATSQNAPFYDNIFKYNYASVTGDHKTIYGYGIGNASEVANGNYAASTYTYSGENTGRTAADRTKIVLKAQLQKDNGNPVELARWYTTEYIGEADLRTAVANTLKYTLYYESGEDHLGIRPEDIQCVAPEYDSDGNITNGAPAGIAAYEVFFQLSDAAQTKTWYKNVSGTMTPITENVGSDPNGIEAANKYLAANVKPAILYKSGQTYYYIDVQHLGNVTDGVDKPGDYGIVRNHIYAININSIGGYGTPAYIGISNIVTPEYPGIGDGGETGSYVAAEVRVLSWRLISQQVDIKP